MLDEEIECPHCRLPFAQEWTDGQLSWWCENTDCAWAPGCACKRCRE